jgi:GrpB-like predicted nucleotidyltransferase (UPF0157 family)
VVFDISWEAMRFFPPDEYQATVGSVYTCVELKLRAMLPLAVIEHIGSSSVPGLWSKGDLDVWVGVSPSAFSGSVDVLTKHGFRVKSDTLQTSELRAFVSDAFAVAVGIQLVAIGSKFEFFRTFRDRLRQSPELRERYNRLKKECADLDEKGYRTIKSQFIESVLASTFE